MDPNFYMVPNPDSGGQFLTDPTRSGNDARVKWALVYLDIPLVISLTVPGDPAR